MAATKKRGSDNLLLANQMNDAISRLFSNAWQISQTDPAQALFLLKMIRWQKSSGALRERLEKQGIHVPPALIVSVTQSCNLQCQGCYAHAQHRPADEEMNSTRLHSLLNEARELGVSLILLAGGEPLTRPDLLDITAEFPEMLFPIFTNGLLIDDAIMERMRRQRHVIPVLSVDGDGQDTDSRRGAGVYGQIQSVVRRLHKHKMFFGLSLTITRNNLDRVATDAYVTEWISDGARLFFFVEYVAVTDDTHDWVLENTQRARLLEKTAEFRNRRKGVFIAFPGDEAELGGCLAAGRGFVHISPSGRVEPCPFAPYSDTNLDNCSLREALQSEFLQTIREQHEDLQETSGGCALWEKRDWVRSLLP